LAKKRECDSGVFVLDISQTTAARTMSALSWLQCGGEIVLIQELLFSALQKALRRPQSWQATADSSLEECNARTALAAPLTLDRKACHEGSVSKVVCRPRLALRRSFSFSIANAINAGTPVEAHAGEFYIQCMIACTSIDRFLL
ncbi:hypothetical protein KCU71_g83, partial [Aureobasidium melanogenum]